MAAIELTRKKKVLALPKGHIDPGETAAEAAVREVREEAGVDSEVEQKLGDVKYVYTWDGERRFKVVSFFLCRYRSGSVRDHDHEVDGAAVAAAGGGAPAARVRRRARHGTKGHRGARGWIGCRPAVYVLNFYSPVFVDQLKKGRKTATIRLGDKSRKYAKGTVVLVTVGFQHAPRERIFEAVIDTVEVKRVSDLSPRDIEHDNPEFRRLDETVHFLEQIYGRKVEPDDTVTIVRFSQISQRPPDITERLRPQAPTRTSRTFRPSRLRGRRPACGR